jgi:hypothetical protein
VPYLVLRITHRLEIVTASGPSGCGTLLPVLLHARNWALPLSGKLDNGCLMASASTLKSHQNAPPCCNAWAALARAEGPRTAADERPVTKSC